MLEGQKILTKHSFHIKHETILDSENPFLFLPVSVSMSSTVMWEDWRTENKVRVICMHKESNHYPQWVRNRTWGGWGKVPWGRGWGRSTTPWAASYGRLGRWCYIRVPVGSKTADTSGCTEGRICELECHTGQVTHHTNNIHIEVTSTSQHHRLVAIFKPSCIHPYTSHILSEQHSSTFIINIISKRSFFKAFQMTIMFLGVFFWDAHECVKVSVESPYTIERFFLLPF